MFFGPISMFMLMKNTIQSYVYVWMCNTEFKVKEMVSIGKLIAKHHFDSTLHTSQCLVLFF